MGRRRTRTTRPDFGRPSARLVGTFPLSSKPAIFFCFFVGFVGLVVLFFLPSVFTTKVEKRFLCFKAWDCTGRDGTRDTGRRKVVHRRGRRSTETVGREHFNFGGLCFLLFSVFSCPPYFEISPIFDSALTSMGLPFGEVTFCIFSSFLSPSSTYTYSFLVCSCFIFGF